jgi:pyruvate/2-oxoglutarate dehydrogenase complex dihydrolipoamide dehydrogenase (E3) component
MRTRGSPKAGERCQLAVIGAGPAGLAAAEFAARRGYRVLLFEARRLGGTSLNTGSVPSKALIRSATLLAAIREVARLQDAAQPQPLADLQRLAARLRNIEARIDRYHSLARLAALGIEVRFASVHFIDRRTLATPAGRVTFDRALVATGARPAAHGITGLTEGSFLTSESIFDLQQLPGRLAVVGGGPLGCELAQAFCRLGAQVTIVQNEPEFLPREERDAAQILARSMARDGVNIILNTQVVGARPENGQVRLQTENYGECREVLADRVLVSVGRVPQLEGLNLESAGITFDPYEGIKVDDFLRTSNPRVYAAGDVCMSHKYTHVAQASAEIAAHNALGRGRARRFSGLTIPWCTFCAPEVAHVGLQVWEARTRHIPVKTYTVMMHDVDRAITDMQDSGFVKLHVAEGSDRLLGATIVAARASEMINEVCVAMHRGIGLRALAEVVHTYPTQSAAIRMAARSFCADVSPETPRRRAAKRTTRKTSRGR